MGCGSSKAAKIRKTDSAPLDRLEEQNLKIFLKGDISKVTPAGVQVQIAEVSGEPPTRFAVATTTQDHVYQVTVKPNEVGDDDQERLAENRKVRRISLEIQKKANNGEIKICDADVIKAKTFLTAGEL